MLKEIVPATGSSYVAIRSAYVASRTYKRKGRGRAQAFGAVVRDSMWPRPFCACS